jgi:hypothetical protein
MQHRNPLDETHGVVATALDAAFYRTIYPDVGDGDLDPVSHYVASGWREGRDPAPWFSTRAYLAANADVAKAGWNPFSHFLTRGRREGREVTPSPRGADYLSRRLALGEEPGWSLAALLAKGPQGDRLAERAADDHARRAVAATGFDVAFYLGRNPDVGRSGIDPLDHFMAGGWEEGRDPNADFSLRDYLDANPDVAMAGVNPYWHWLVAGQAEGRRRHVEMGFRYDIIRSLRPLEERVEGAAKATARLRLGSAPALVEALAASRTGLRDLHVTFSHDDYTANTGGVQLCLQREDARIAELGRDHLHLYPAKPWPVARARGEPAALGVLLNGARLGVFSPETVREALARKTRRIKPGRRSFAIHSLLGHNAVETVDILAALDLSEGFFWLHDFASLCAGYHLLRDEVEDCAAPPPGSMACGVCVFGPYRQRQLDEHERLFERLSLTVVSPSEPTLKLWKAAGDYRSAREVVAPHARLVERGEAPVAAERRPLRVAYLGMPVAHKGWGLFRDLVAAHAGDGRYRFLHLGGRRAADVAAEFHRVSVNETRPLAMREAIEAFEVDVALIWPLCRETFSFTAYEAVAAGAAVVTGPDSGNVAAFVTAGGHGRVVPDEAALAELFASGAAAKLLSRAHRRPKLYDLAFSGLTVDLLEDRA